MILNAGGMQKAPKQNSCVLTMDMVTHQTWYTILTHSKYVWAHLLSDVCERMRMQFIPRRQHRNGNCDSPGRTCCLCAYGKSYLCFDIFLGSFHVLNVSEAYWCGYSAYYETYCAHNALFSVIVSPSQSLGVTPMCTHQQRLVNCRRRRHWSLQVLLWISNGKIKHG